jgi:hypothetical protein
MPRPKKHRNDPQDLRTQIREPGEIRDAEQEQMMSRVFRQGMLDDARVDPFRDEPPACVLAPVILKRGSAQDKEMVGSLFVHTLENFTADQAESYFKRVLALKRNAENLPLRNGFVYYAYSSFIEEFGFEPSKARLKKFILAKPEVYKDTPPAEDKKAWSRVWRESGLFTLPQG